MNKKGFTLVELLAVIVILGLLIAIISPVVNNLLNDSKDSLSKNQIDMIITASKKYMIDHSELLPEGDSAIPINISLLVESGVIDNDRVIDPKTKQTMNGCVIVTYSSSYNQYEYNYSSNDSDCLVTVTFDPEGGNVDTTSKQVTFNSTYGDLPTPTREGYTFKGWRGKNMLGFSGRTVKNPGGTSTNTSKRNFTGDGIYLGITANNYYYAPYLTSYNIDSVNNNVVGISANGGYGIGFDLNVLPNTQYTVSFAKEATPRLGEYMQDGTYINWNNSHVKQQNATITTTNDTKWILFVADYGINIQFEYYNIQIEKGDTATEFEPYQEYSSDTVVTKSSDHTLHAIWEVAS